MTQLEESLVATSLQTIISDQAFAMHGLTQLSDIQTVLKEMHDKKEIQDQQEVQDKQETLTQSQSIDSSMSGQNSRQGSRAASRAPSRSSSRAGSRAVSPSHTPISLSRTNSFSRMKSDLPSTPESPGINPYIINKEAIPVIDEKKDEKKNEKDVDDGVGDEHDDKKKIKKNNGDGVDDDNEEGGGDDDEDEDEEDITKTGDTSFARLASQLVAMIKQAEEAVEVPVKGREPKPRQLSNASQASQFDFDNLINDLDNYLEEDGEEVAEEGLIKTPKENTDPIQDRKKVGHSKQKSRQEEEFQQSLDVFAKNFNNILAEIEHEVGGNDDADMLNGEIISPNMLSSQYIDPINHPSEDLADLDDFAQQCRLLTRALILPFLHATHSFMSESLQTTNTSYTPRSVTSTTRSFMNLMYWTFLFTLGTLVLDAWLCEVAGQQVIRMVGMLKPGQVFNNIDKNNNIEHQHHNAIELDQDGDAKMVEDSKKKNVKICTCLEMKAVTYLINNNNNFYTNNNNTNINNHNNEKQDIFLQSPIAINDSNYYINNNHYNINNNNNNKRSSISSNINYSDNIIDQQRQKDNNDIHDHEMEEYEEEDLDLNIPGSFPSAFKWTPQSSHLNINNRKDNVRRVKSVVLRRPKRNGSFSSSGGHWVVRTRKVRTRHNNNNNKILKRNNSKSSSISKNKGTTKSTSLPERIWVRRNSI